LLFMAMVAVVFSALGTLIGSTLKDMQGFQLIMNFWSCPSSFCRERSIRLNNLPAPLAAATRLDPLTYGVDGLRGALIGLSQNRTARRLRRAPGCGGAVSCSRRASVRANPGLTRGERDVW
jgi:ABC-type multidrug transport system permease subunit